MLKPTFLLFVAKLRRLRSRRRAALAVLSPTSTPAVLPKRAVAHIESLEDRLCPSASVAVGDFNGGGLEDLRIRGADSGQRVVITDDPVNHETLVQIDADGDGLFNGANDFNQLFEESFNQIKVKLNNGQNNSVDYRLASDLENADREFVLKLGAGANSFQFDAQQHAVADNSRLTFSVAGVDGASNAVTFAMDEIVNAEVKLAVNFSSGAHDVKTTFFGPIHDDSLVNVDIAMGAGDHSVKVELLGDISNSTVHALINGGDDARGHDNVSYAVSGELSNDALVDIGMALHAGDDIGMVTLAQGTFAARDTSRIYTTIDGGTGDDALHYSGDGAAGGTIPVEGLVDGLILGQDGNDRITADFSSLNALDLTGTFRLRAEGGKGNDAIDAGVSNTTNSIGSYDVVLKGNSGDDALSLFNDDPTGGILYKTYGFDLIDGGKGFDLATTMGSFIDVQKTEG